MKSQKARRPSAADGHVAAAALLTLACVSLAVAQGRHAVAGLSRPYDADQFRDIAAAQSVVDGAFPSDPFYRGETIWYNPLLPAAIALVSRITRLDVPTAYVQSGPFLNALAPLALLMMIASMVGPWPAFVAVASLLFAPPHSEPAWVTPTYSPWLFPANFSTVFFYAGLLVCWLAMRDARRRWWAAVGLSLGLTFLAHTAPALILGVCIVAGILSSSGREALDRPDKRVREAFVRLALVFGVAAVTGAPLLWSIVGHYRLIIVNAAPNNWAWANVDLAHARALLWGSLNIKNLVAAVGATALAARIRKDDSARLILWWVFAAAALYGYGYLQQAIGFDHLPPLLPQYHFFLYLRAVGHVLTGVGSWIILTYAVGAVAHRWLPSATEERVLTLSALATVVLVISFTAGGFRAYKQRTDFREVALAASRLSRQDTGARVLERLRAETAPDAVVLASIDDSLLQVAPAGRAVVAVPREFSNPYVDFDKRADDQRHMLAAFLARNLAAFDEVAREYGVTHVLLNPVEFDTFERQGPLPYGFVERSRSAGFVLYERTAGGTRPATRR